MTRTEARRTQITCEFVQRVMADEDAGHSPFGLAGLWENWRDPNTGEWQRTFAIITVPSNGILTSRIHLTVAPQALHNAGRLAWGSGPRGRTGRSNPQSNASDPRTRELRPLARA